MVIIMTQNLQTQVHPFPPIYDASSRILILGSFPSVKSRETQFYYGHARNRFWKTVAAVLHTETPQNIDEKKEFLLNNHIALWDACASCTIQGSADAAIRDVVPNDIAQILHTAEIRAIFCNGKTAYALFQKYILPKQDLLNQTPPYFALPSTSPANAGCSDAQLLAAWSCIADYV